MCWSSVAWVACSISWASPTTFHKPPKPPPPTHSRDYLTFSSTDNNSFQFLSKACDCNYDARDLNNNIDTIVLMATDKKDTVYSKVLSIVHSTGLHVSFSTFIYPYAHTNNQYMCLLQLPYGVAGLIEYGFIEYNKPEWLSINDLQNGIIELKGTPDEMDRITKIYLLTYEKQNPTNDAGVIVDYKMTEANLQAVINLLAPKMDEDDQMIFFVNGHGGGYFNYDKLLEKYNYQLVEGSRFTLNETADELDYTESNFMFRWKKGLINEKCGLGAWDASFGEDGSSILISNEFYRYKNVSTFTDIKLKNGTTKSDNDVYIEQLRNYLLGDINRNGLIEAGELIDNNKNGVKGYKRVNGILEFDPGDWGDVHLLFDNYNTINNILPNNNFSNFIIFDKGRDNMLDIDINPTCSIGNCSESELVADGTDTNNDGVFEGINFNGNSNKNEWVSVDESLIWNENNNGTISTYGVFDDNLKLYLDNIASGKIIFMSNTCYSGGFVEELSKNNRIILTSTIEEDQAYDQAFLIALVKAFASPNLYDTNKDGLLSFTEAFNSSKVPVTNSPAQYDDNGDKISNTQNLPKGGDGNLGNIVTISEKYFCPQNSTLNLSSTLSNVYKMEGASTTIKSSEKISGSSVVKYFSEGTIVLLPGFEIGINTQFEAKTMVANCN